MQEKKYLSFPKKVAYGLGDFGSNFFYMMVTSFMLLYMTNAVGLDPGIAGTLMMASRILDGITDVFFGHLIDKTKSKLGKARPWMFYSGFPLAACLILLFMIPVGVSTTTQYVYFFIVYTLANAIFYTANNISYATLSALITRSDSERVSLGTFRFIFAIIASVAVTGGTVSLVSSLGANGWRTVAIIYAVVFLAFNTISSLCSKELPPEDTDVREEKKSEKTAFGAALKVVLSNKYYLLALAIYILMYTSSGIGTAIGTYYCQYVLGNASLLGLISMSAFIMIIGLIANPGLVKKFGMYKVNLISYLITIPVAALLMFFGYRASFIGVLVLTFIRGITTARLQGSINAIIAEVGQNAYLKKNVHVEGMMFSCTSVGMKVGSGLGTAISGWMLSAAHFVGEAEQQTEGVLNAIKFTYGAIPLIIVVLITVCLWRMHVVEENAQLQAAKAE